MTGQGDVAFPGRVRVCAIVLVWCAACGSIGCRPDLAGARIRDLRLGLASSGTLRTEGWQLCPGEAAPLVATAILEDGSELATEGAGKGTVPWSSFRVSAQRAEVEDGVVRLPADPRLTASARARLRIEVAGRPDAAAGLEIAARHDCDFVADFRGARGAPGADGAAGSTGVDGVDQKLDFGAAARNYIQESRYHPGYDTPGDAGGDGRPGRDGGDGQPGAAAAPVVVRATCDRGECETLQIEVRSGARIELYLVDAGRGSLSILAGGGDGGRGGRGGLGGCGGRGGTGAPAGEGGPGGDGGNGGSGGDGGPGGRMIVIVDPKAAPHLSRALRVDIRGGQGGARGAAGPGGCGQRAFVEGMSYQRRARPGRTGAPGNRAGIPGPDGSGPRIEVIPIPPFW